MRSGNGWAIFIPKTILKLIDIIPEKDKIELEVENKVLKVKKPQILKNKKLNYNKSRACIGRS